jgi:hypothetical protein
MEQLKVNVEGRKSKNVDILLLSEQVTIGGKISPLMNRDPLKVIFPRERG